MSTQTKNLIPVNIPNSLRKYCGEWATLSAAGDSIAEVLDFLSRAYPELHRSICDETGAVRRHINIFINSQWIPVQEESGRQSAIGPKDVLTIWTAVSGG